MDNHFKFTLARMKIEHVLYHGQKTYKVLMLCYYADVA